MDQSTTISSSTEDLCSIDTTDADNTLSFPISQSDNISNEELERQIEDLTKQLNESKSAATRANAECEKCLQINTRTNERFLAFERKQLDQLRRLLSILTSDQRKILSAANQEDYQRPRRAFTSPSTSLLLPSALHLDDANITADFPKTENDWNFLLAQISEIMDFSERFTAKCSEQTDENNKLRLLNNEKQDENVKLLYDLSLTKAEYEQEQQMRNQFEHQFNEANKVIEQDRTKRLQKLRNYASLADDEGDILLSSLMKKAEKNDIDFREMKLQYEHVFVEQINQLKKLVKERELLHLYIQRLEKENALLASRTNEDETVRLLTYSSQTPTSDEEAWNLIGQLREQILQQIKLQDSLRNDIQQLQYSHKTDMHEREQIEELLNRDITAAKDEILVLQSIRSEYDRTMSFKRELERQLEDCANELISTQSIASSLSNQLKENLDQFSLEKEKLNEENARLRVQLQKLKVDFENSESVQHDFVKLSQTLQVQLEEFRNSGTELRWQPEEDFSECQRCHSSFSVTWRKHHCRHCGKVLCKDCTSKTIYTGSNSRPSRVCDVCYTLLDKNAQPYFLTNVHKF